MSLCTCQALVPSGHRLDDGVKFHQSQRMRGQLMIQCSARPRQCLQQPISPSPKASVRSVYPITGSFQRGFFVGAFLTATTASAGPAGEPFWIIYFLILNICSSSILFAVTTGEAGPPCPACRARRKSRRQTEHGSRRTRVTTILAFIPFISRPRGATMPHRCNSIETAEFA
jgi:hypothetical protein